MHALTRRPSLPLYSDLPAQRTRSLAEQLPLAGPLGVQIQTVAACTFACRLCPVSEEHYDARGTMSDADFARIIEKVAGPGTLKTVRPYGLGEPLLDKTIDRKIAQIVALGTVRSELTSNAARLTPALAERLVRSGLQYLRWSVYGTTPDNLAAYIGRPVGRYSPHKIFENIRLFARVRAALRSETPRIHIEALPEQEAEVALRLAGAYDSIGSNPRHNWARFDAPDANTLHSAKQVCPYPFYFMQVNANGDCYPCGIQPTSLKLGNLLAQSLDDVWNGPRAQEIRAAHLARHRQSESACAKCTYLHESRDSLEDYHPKRVS